MHYEVIVVGAGPAGASAALRLARAGCRVLVLEKERLGRHKPCGGGLTPRAYADLDVPIDDLVVARTSAVELRLAGRCLARLRAAQATIWMVRRAAFDRRLAEAALAAGADLHEVEPAVAVEVEPRSVVVATRRARYTAELLLLACGAESRLRAAAGLRAPARRAAVAIELEGPATADDFADGRAVLDYAVPGGYAWAFPKGDCWNVGVGAIAAPIGSELRQRLAQFVARSGLCFHASCPPPQRAVGRRIPVWCGWCSLACGRVALLGDAAGLADPLFAEGIGPALASGRLAADAVLDVLAGQRADLSGYTAAVRKALGRHLARARCLARWVYPAPGLWIRALAALPLARRLAERVVAAPFALQRAAASHEP